MSCNRFSLQKTTKQNKSSLVKNLFRIYFSVSRNSKIYTTSLLYLPVKWLGITIDQNLRKKQRYYHEIVSLQIVDTDYLAQFGLLEKINFDG